MTHIDTSKEAVSPPHYIYINRSMVFDADVTWTTVAGRYPHAYVPVESYDAEKARADAAEARAASLTETIVNLRRDMWQAMQDARKAALREVDEATDPDFIWGALDNVHDAETTLEDYAAAVSRAQRAAILAMIEEDTAQ